MAQADKVYTSITAAEDEYQRLFADTKFPNDVEKKKATEWAGNKETLFHINRLLYQDLKAKRTRMALTIFVGGAMMFLDSPESTFTRYDFADKTLKDGKDVYANLSKVESLVAEFRVYTLSVLREVK